VTFFESLLALLLTAILLLQLSRRLSLPYPAMLAAAGVVLALIPGLPSIALDPRTALPLFIAPALLDAAFDFPAGEVRKLWKPLFALAVVAVLLTVGAVTALGALVAGLPLYAAMTLGAIVAPPDAAAASPVLRSLRLPRRSTAVLMGEGLLNDATALLLFGAAVGAQLHGGFERGDLLRLGLAAPGGVVLGIGIATLYRRIVHFVSGTLGGSLLEFVVAFAVWIIADRLGFSAVLCTVAFAMTMARDAGLRQSPRDRVHSYAVWQSAVFLVNVLAFLLMGLQARSILSGMSTTRLHQALDVAGLVVVCVIGVRLAWVIVYNRLGMRFVALRGDFEPANLRQGVLVGWCGMRGLITLATAFALPASFPQRDLIVLTAFSVVLATLVVQGVTLAPLARLLRLDTDDGPDRELIEARMRLAEAGLDALRNEKGVEADHLKHFLQIERAGPSEPRWLGELSVKRALSLMALDGQRKELQALRAKAAIDPETFSVLQQELDFQELALIGEDKRRIDEN
jgi:monovalent cation/hydrogen antiporter